MQNDMFDFLDEVTEEKKTKSDFAAYEPGQYEFTVTSAAWGDAVDYDKNPTKQITVKGTLYNPMEADGSVTTLDNKALVNPGFTQWLQLAGFGWNKKTKQPKVGRMLVTALLGIAPDASLADIKESAEVLVGKKCIVMLNVKAKENGDMKNVVDSAKAVKKKS